jgi:putative CocE/NonD family hydrolase
MRVANDRPWPALRGIRRQINARVPMRDGIALSTDIYTPDADEPRPTVLVRTPYNNSDGYYLEQMRFWTDRGYAFVVQDCRGHFDSEGEFRPWFNEPTDGFDTQEWVGRQRWCNGKIGTTGTSYDGATQWLAAPLGSTFLSAMVPGVVPSDYWEQDHYFGGAFSIGLNLSWAIRNAFHSKRELTPEEIVELWWHLPLVDADALAGTDIPWYREWLEHPSYDDFWRPLSTREHWSSINVPVLNVAGWYDAYAGAAIEHFSGMVANGAESVRDQQWLVLGPWHHLLGERLVGQLDFGPTAVSDLRELEARFFDHHLRGLDVGLSNEPRIRLFTMGTNRWRSEHKWPLARTRRTPWYLAPAGRLTTTRPVDAGSDWFLYDPANPVITVGGNHSLLHPGMSVGPHDQRLIERRADVLVYSSDVLTESIDVTGDVSSVLFLSSDAPDTDVTIRLVDVYPDGRAMNLCEGVLRARYHDSLTHESLLTPSRVYELKVPLTPTSNVFLPGHRIRVDISSSNFPRIDRNLNTADRVGFGTGARVARNSIHRDTSWWRPSVTRGAAHHPVVGPKPRHRRFCADQVFCVPSAAAEPRQVRPVPYRGRMPTRQSPNACEATLIRPSDPRRLAGHRQ